MIKISNIKVKNKIITINITNFITITMLINNENRDDKMNEKDNERI